jgi:hypothetical protein
VAHVYARALGFFPSPLTTRRATVEVFYPASTREVQWSSQSQSQSYITTDSQSANPSWCQEPIRDPRSIFPLLSLIFFPTVSGLLLWGALSVEKSSLYFQFLPGIDRATFLRSDHSLCSLFFRLTQPGGPGSCIFSPPPPPSNRVAQLHLRALDLSN